MKAELCSVIKEKYMIITVFRMIFLLGLFLTILLTVMYCRKSKDTEKGKENIAFGKKHAVYNSVVALIANFLDVEGIGTHAVNAIGFKLGKSVEDMNMPGTMNIGATVPCCLAAFLFFPLAQTDTLTLVLMIVAAVAGAFLLAGIIGKLNMLGIRLLMGVGLIIMSIFILIRAFKLGNVDFEGAAVGLTGGKLVIGVVCSFIFGGLMNIGVGYYAPILAVCSMLGLDLTSSMSIMFGACAMLMAFGSAPKLIKTGKFDVVAVFTQFVFGTAGVVLAYLFVKSLPVNTANIIVAFAVIITGILFVKDYFSGVKAAQRRV